MFVLRFIGKSIDTLLDRIFSVLGALVVSQLPQIMQQYYDVLTGALAEATRNVEVFRQKAAEVGLDLNAFIDEHLRSSSAIFQKSGEGMRAAALRLEEYQTAHTALRDAYPWERPFVFLQHMDPGLFDALEFVPGVPLTAEGAIYAFVGILFGLGIYHLFRTLPAKLFGRRRMKMDAEF